MRNSSLRHILIAPPLSAYISRIVTTSTYVQQPHRRPTTTCCFIGTLVLNENVPCVENTAGFARWNQQILREFLLRSISEMFHLKFSGKKGRKEWSPGDYQVFISSVMAQEFPGRTKDKHGKSQLIEITIKFLRKMWKFWRLSCALCFVWRRDVVQAYVT